MRRLLVLAPLLPLLLAAPAGAAPALRFSFGVAAGEVRSDSALLWARANREGSARVLVTPAAPASTALVRTATARVRRATDFTMQARVGRLRPGTTYAYRFFLGRARSALGRFTTAPDPRRARTIRFAWSGDMDAQPARGSTVPFYNTQGDRSFAALRAMRREGNDFNILLGDTIYSDSEVGASVVNGVYRGSTPALTRAQKWAKYRQNLALRNFPDLRGATGLYSHPDDHEWINDFGPNETLTGTSTAGRRFAVNGRRLYPVGVQAFRDYAPTGYSTRNGFYRTFRWGRDLELFFLDERSFRSAKAGSDFIHTCDNPQTKAPDLAPTAPADKRALFGALVPSFREPVSAACLAAIRSPKRTFLGVRQRREFLRAVARSTATWKVIVNEVPIQLFYALPYDFWEGYAYERNLVLRDLQRRAKNVVWLATDHHGNLAGPIRYSTFRSEGGERSSGMYEVATGPVATMSYKREFDSAVGRSDAGELVDSVFLEPKPDAGLGLDCSAIDVFSYGEVTVRGNRLSVALKDQNGRPVRDETPPRPACPTLSLTARR